MSAEPTTDRTRAINAMNDRLQDVGEVVVQIKTMLEAERAQRESWKSALYRLLKEAISLLFPGKNGKKD